MSASTAALSSDLHGFRLDQDVNVYVPALGRRTAKYHDGSEEYVLKTIREASDLSTGSEELVNSVRDFASLYHFSPDRANLLRPLQHLLLGSIVEIGAGCGAITRFLGETGSQVLALEATYGRAVVCRSRCRDLTNVTVVAGELVDLEARSNFDVVVAVGVLEYSPMFMGGRKGPKAFLQACKRLLRPGGHLILAIENQLGLKYFAGAPEDHLDAPYSGVEGRYSDVSPITFGHRELRRLITSVGWTRQQFLYPFPDYKFPTVILGAEALDDDPDLAASVLRFTPAADPSQQYYPSFSEELVWPSAVRNGFAHAIANSFLVVASDGHGQFARCPIHVFSTRRQRRFAKVAVMDPAVSNTVRRSALYPAVLPIAGPVYQKVEDERLLRGKLLQAEFCDVLNQPGWTVQQFVDVAAPWVLYLRSFKISPLDEADPLLPGELLDCIPANLIRDGSGILHPFDQEWVSREPVLLSRVVVRGVYDVLLRLRSVAKRGGSSSSLILDLVVECLDLIGFSPAKEKAAHAIQQEVEFQAHVTGEPRSLDLYLAAQLRCTRRPELLRNLGAVPLSETQSQDSLLFALLEARENIERLSKELDLLKSSRSYRVSRRVSRAFSRLSSSRT